MSIVLQGSTSGSITLQEPAIAGSNTINLPAATGTMALLQTPSFATTIGVGGATPAASGAGITFPATQSASSDANTLDDYEEGTWTPTIISTGGAPATYGTQEGKYTKIGNMVYLTGVVRVSSSIPAGNYVRISNLPFGQAAGQSGSAIKYSGATSMPSGQFISATTAGSEINLIRNDGNGETGVVGLNSSYTTSSFEVVFSAMYRVS